MKILQVSPAFYPALSIGGPVLSTLALNRLLVTRHEVTTLTTSLGLDPDAVKGIVFGRPMVGSAGDTLIYQPYYGYPHFTWSPATLSWLLQHVHKFDVVLLHGVWNFPLMAAAWACQRRGIPYALFPHGTLAEERVAQRSRRKKRLMLALFVQRMLERASRVVFTSQYELDRVRSHLCFKFTPAIVPNIVDSNEFDVMPRRGALRRRLKISDDAVVLLHLGRVTPVKRLSTTVHVLAKLLQAGAPVVLLVVGGDDAGHLAEIVELAEYLGVSNKVFFTGLLRREDSKQAFADADIFLLPSLSENFGMAVVEAMLAKLPVVVSDQVGLAQELAGSSAGVVVPYADGHEGFANAVSRLIEDPSRRRQLAEAGQAFAAATYSAVAVDSRIEQLLNSMLSEAA